MTEETLRAVLRDELSYLWTDLNTARQQAINGQWSMHCDWIVERIKTITSLVGPTPWQDMEIKLIEDGVYQRVHEELGVDAPVDMDGVRAHRRRLDEGAQL